MLGTWARNSGQALPGWGIVGDVQGPDVGGVNGFGGNGGSREHQQGHASFYTCRGLSRACKDIRHCGRFDS